LEWSAPPFVGAAGSLSFATPEEAIAVRYAAFISYNHRDRKVAAWLHRSLEAYRIPPRLRGQETALGVLGTRLPPVFQDREELSASSDLAASVREALNDAASLIVICSPDGAQSRWVNEEIRTFTALGRRDRIQCLIISGEPNASRVAGGDKALECLPPALFENDGGEPLAADIRAGQDGRTAARLKLLAGVLGVPYDELRQREQARRQRRLAWLAAASTAGFALTSGLAVAALLARAEAVEQRDMARKKTVTAERTVDFVRSMFEVADPSESRGRTITAREIIDLGAARVDRELAGEPSVRAALGTTLGETYSGLGLLDKGEALIQRMLAVPSVDLSTRARQYVALGTTFEAKAEDRQALAAYSRALALARDPKSGRSDLVSRSLVGIGFAQTMLGEMEVGERTITQALQLDRQRGDDGTLDLARGLEALGTNQLMAGKLEPARYSYKEALAIRSARQGSLHPRTIQLLNQLGSVSYLRGDAPAAERYFAQVLPLREKVLGPIHPEMATSLNNYARLLLERREYKSARVALKRAVDIQLSQRGEAGADLAFLYSNYGIALRGSGQAPEGRRYLEKGLEVATSRKHRNEAPIIGELADLACASGNTRYGLSMLERARPVMTSAYPKDPWRSAWLDVIAADCLSKSGRTTEAARLRTRSAPILAAKWSAGTHYGARLAKP
jgi:tetratricopeptide (TPR) repeat protein